MENKFYTPALQDFHIGFECYKKVPHTDGGHQLSLGENTTTGVFVIRDIYDMPTDQASLSWFQVKVLDREDIESLGFSGHKKAVRHWFYLVKTCQTPNSHYSNRGFTLQWDETYGGVIITGYEYASFIDDGSEQVLYNGKCRNKSELKRILTLIGILDESGN